MCRVVNQRRRDDDKYKFRKFLHREPGERHYRYLVKIRRPSDQKWREDSGTNVGWFRGEVYLRQLSSCLRDGRRLSERTNVYTHPRICLSADRGRIIGMRLYSG